MKKHDAQRPETIRSILREEQLLLHLPQPAFLLTDAGVVLQWNEAAATAYQLAAGDAEGHALAELPVFSTTDVDALCATVSDEGSWEGRGVRLRADGSTATVAAVWTLLHAGEDGKLLLAVEHDITEALRIESELEQARKLARIGVLSEGIAHELRNPISYALSAAQLLEDPRLPEDVRAQCIRTITEGLKKAGRIVDNLLALGKPQAAFARGEIDLADALEEALEAARSHANAKHVRVATHLPGLPLRVLANHDMLVQVFFNVVTNAFNEMKDGGSIHISAEAGEDIATIRVEDSGPGVRKEDMRHLFDPFFTASRSGTGTGLGLTLTYYIMKEHGGSIEVESEPGRGATFILQFPLLSPVGD